MVSLTDNEVAVAKTAVFRVAEPVEVWCRICNFSLRNLQERMVGRGLLINNSTVDVLASSGSTAKRIDKWDMDETCSKEYRRWVHVNRPIRSANDTVESGTGWPLNPSSTES